MRANGAQLVTNLVTWAELLKAWLALTRGTQREYSSKPLKHRIVKRILVFKR